MQISQISDLVSFLHLIVVGSIHHGDQIWISRLKKGGIAYRTGMLHSGDILLAINGVGLETANLSQAAEMLKNAGERVSLKVSKENGELSTQQCQLCYSCNLVNSLSLSITCVANVRFQKKLVYFVAVW